MKFFRIILLIAAFCYSKEIKIQKSDIEYSIKYTAGESRRVLSFRKTSEDSCYNYLHYSTSYKPVSLKQEAEYIDSLWTSTEGNLNICLKTANIGYPLEYPDIMPGYIQAFLDSEDWMSYVSENGKKLDYDIIHDVIASNNIYPYFTKILEDHRFCISAVSSEKHGFLSEEQLLKYGFEGDEIIPVPYILYWNLEPVGRSDTICP